MSIAEISSRIHDSLVDTKDAVLRINPILSEHSLTTVMGSCQDQGEEDLNDRILALEQSSDLAPFFNSLADDAARNELYKLLAEHIRQRINARLVAVHDETRDMLVLHLDEVLDIATLATNQINSVFSDTKALVQASIKQDDAMTPQRRQAIEDFTISISMVKQTIMTIMRIEHHISDVQSKLNERFNSDDICATASDTTRAELSSLRKELEGQRSYQERQLLEHFNETARTRTSDARIQSVALVIPDSLISKGRGLELIDNANANMNSCIPQFYAISAFHKRIGADFNATTGCFWQPPTKANGYSDVPVEFRDAYITQNKAYALLILQHVTPEAAAAVQSIYQYGIHKQFSTKADEDDGLSIYFGLVSLSRPSAASYREEIDNQLNSAADLFRRGDPTKKIKSLRPFLTEALRLKMRIKWTVGKKIITTLALRHSTFAVDLAYLKETAPNTEDSAGHIDRLFAQITKSCADIEMIQGDRWADVQAHYGNSNNGNKGKGGSNGNSNNNRNNNNSNSNNSKSSSEMCRYGDKCTRGSDCRYSHKKGSNSGQQGRSMDKCCAENCNSKTAGKGKKYCNTCFKRGLQKGNLKDKQGKERNFTRAAAARSKRDDKEIFSAKQLSVLQQMHEGSVTKRSLFDAANDMPPGPISFKRAAIAERLGPKLSEEDEQVAQAMKAITMQ